MVRFTQLHDSLTKFVFLAYTACQTTVSLIVRVPTLKRLTARICNRLLWCFYRRSPLHTWPRYHTSLWVSAHPRCQNRAGNRLIRSCSVRYWTLSQFGPGKSRASRQGIEAFLVAVLLQRGAGDQSLPRVPAQSRGAALAIGDQRVERVGRVVDRQVVCLAIYSHPQADPAERSLPVSRQLGFFTRIQRRAPRNVVRSAVGPKGRVVEKFRLLEKKKSCEKCQQTQNLWKGSDSAKSSGREYEMLPRFSSIFFSMRDGKWREATTDLIVSNGPYSPWARSRAIKDRLQPWSICKQCDFH